MLHAEDPQTITLKGENDVLKVIPKADVESVEVSERSVMPEGLAYSMTTQDFRDLVRYLTASPVIADWRAGPDGRRIQLGASGKLEFRGTATAKVTALAAVKTKLVLTASAAVKVTLDGKQVYAGTPDQAAFDVDLAKGDHTLTVEAAAATLTARLLDPERKLTYPE
ncbi:MAG: hypothetical protein U0746_21080 [Gemmataceae bacterium]